MRRRYPESDPQISNDPKSVSFYLMLMWGAVAIVIGGMAYDSPPGQQLIKLILG